MKFRMNKSQKGFTLIELLVVIAIIGILAALVLVALGNARDKANDARVKSDVAQLRTLAEVIYDSGGGSYAGVETCIKSDAGCQGTTASVNALIADGLAASGATITSESTASTFCIIGTMQSDSDQHVCVDASGATTTNTAITCPISGVCT